MVDGLGVGDVGNIVLRDRQHLAEDGIIIVVLTLEDGSRNSCLQDLISYPVDLFMSAVQRDLMEEAKQVLDEMQWSTAWIKASQTGARSRQRSKILSVDFVWKETKRRPMIMPIIMEV